MRRAPPTEDEAYDQLRDEHPEDTPQPWVNPKMGPWCQCAVGRCDGPPGVRCLISTYVVE